MESETTASGKPEGQIQIVAQSHCKSGSWVVTVHFCLPLARGWFPERSVGGPAFLEAMWLTDIPRLSRAFRQCDAAYPMPRKWVRAGQATRPPVRAPSDIEEHDIRIDEE